MANTLLSYFKDALARRGASAKYLNRDFLARFITEYNESRRTGRANYPRTMETKFYQENGGAYCVFLEEWNEYRHAMDRAKNWLEEAGARLTAARRDEVNNAVEQNSGVQVLRALLDEVEEAEYGTEQERENLRALDCLLAVLEILKA